jgi:TM2 domain-containing membrane protein YozV
LDKDSLAWSLGATAPESAAAGPGASPDSRKPWVAGLLSWLIPGLGHFYLRRFQRGLVWLVVEIIAILAVGNLPVLQSWRSFDWTFSFWAGLDAFLVARRLRDGKLRPENLERKRWLVPVAAVLVVAYVVAITFAVRDVITDPPGQVRFGRTVVDDENLSLVDEAQQFTAGSSLAFRARFREPVPPGTSLLIELINVSGTGQTVIESTTELLEHEADIYSLRDWVPSSQRGTYRIRITRSGRLEAIGTFTLTAP